MTRYQTSQTLSAEVMLLSPLTRHASLSSLPQEELVENHYR